MSQPKGLATLSLRGLGENPQKTLDNSSVAAQFRMILIKIGNGRGPSQVADPDQFYGAT